jgi:hypothetical protein
MRMRVLFFMILVLLPLAEGAAAAPIVGLSADTIPAGTFMLDTSFLWRDYQRAWDDGLYPEGGGWIDLPEGSRMTAGSLVPRICYGVTDRLTVQVAVPLEDRYTQLAESDGQDSNTGLGDIIVDPKLQVYRGANGTPRIALLAGVQLPTGDAEGTPPLSDGSTDFMVGGIVTHDAGQLTAHASVVYWLNGEDADGFDEKDTWAGTATIEARVSGGWSLLWELRSTLGEEPSRYYRVYACPGVSWSGARLTIGMSGLISAAAHGGGGVSWMDFTWAPCIRVIYRFS